ncbi:MAG: lamin tail domain-containing protein [Verrucomicrobiae bacterium]|nr:lamin tail domain-containing protein [Verrucomicrobiae bacterium]
MNNSDERSPGQWLWVREPLWFAWLVALGAIHYGATALGAAAVNLAAGQPVEASGPTWGTFALEFVADGNPDTFNHPRAASGTLGFYFQVDLGRTFALDHIVTRNRSDGCCPERLSNYQVEVYGDREGEPGELHWSTRIRADGSHSGVGGRDVLTASLNPTGQFVGRFIRVLNADGAPYSPQVAEIEVYGGTVPRILQFASDADTLAVGASTVLRWELLNASEAEVEPDIGPVDPVRGSVTVRPAATTTYRLVARNEAGLVETTQVVGVNVVLDPPRITEFLADNADGLKDEDGDAQDWIELHNPNAFGLGLAGYFLSDDPDRLRKWPLPDVRIPAGGYLVVFASGKDRRDPERPLHTNFRMAAAGEYLALAGAADTRPLQQFPAGYPVPRRFPPQQADISYGADTRGAIGFFRPPTPGASNGVAFEGIVAGLNVRAERGFHDGPLQVVLHTETPGAAIRYTTNRTEPTATAGLVYEAPVAIERTTVLRAAAFRPGWSPAPPVTHTYVFPDQVVSSPVMRTAITRDPRYQDQMRPALLDLPSVALTTARPINDTLEVTGTMEWLRPDGGPGFQVPCGLKQFGGAFTEFAKKSFRLYFRSEYGAAKLRYPLFEGHDSGLTAVQEFDALELRSGSHDMEMRGFYMANLFTDETLLEMGRLNPHGRFVHLYLNGIYWGLYHLRERWHAAMHQQYLGGSKADYEAINGNWNVGGWAEPGSAYDGDGSTWAHARSLRDRYQDLRHWVDVPQYVDYMLMWMFGGSEDEYRCVGPVVPGTGFQFHLNDADGWFCIPAYCAAGNRTVRGAPGRQPGDGPGSLFSTLFREGDPEYRMLLADAIHRNLANGGALTPERNAARLTRQTEAITRAFLAESARWNYLTPDAWAARRDSALHSWLPRRTAEARSQFRSAGFLPSLDAPSHLPAAGSVPSGTVLRFTGPAAAGLHYTLDGTDPRLPGGAVSPAARTLTLGGGTRTLVPAGARWRWFTNARGLSTSDVVVGHPTWSSADWKHPSFDDTQWAEGPAELGYGEGDEATVIPYGGNASAKWMTIYFRHRFALDRTGNLVRTDLRLRRDDGAIVYVNGHPAVRDSMPAGVVTGTTAASNATDDGQEFLEFEIPTELLRGGDNVLAVELHQASPSSSDASFDLELTVGTAASGAEPEFPLLTRNTIVKSRALQGDRWSALNVAFFQVGELPAGPGDLVVTEIYCAPPEGGDDAEFLELVNRSDHAVNLRGARFTDGIRYGFPDTLDTLLGPGQRLVLAADLFHFRRNHGLAAPVAGRYFGQLSDTGERLRLETAEGLTLLDLTYATTPPWPAGTGGGGYSLVLARPELGPANPSAWRASVHAGGTPGASDATLLEGDPDADADGDGLSALTEHALGTSDRTPGDAAAALQPRVLPDGGFQLAISRRLSADDVALTVTDSTNLVVWTPARLVSSERAGPDVVRELWTPSQPAGAPIFMRLQVMRR